MPLSLFKRKIRRMARRARNWITVAQLTLQGNKVSRNTRLINSRSPVLMIYGLGATRRTMAILETRLKQEGFLTFSLNLGGFIGTFNTVTIEQSAHYIAKKIDRLYSKYNIKGKLSVVGHSKGGLIGAYYIKFLNGASRVKTFVTIGTPHNGTPWAILSLIPPIGFVVKSLKQLSPQSDFLKKLRETRYPKSVKVFSIYSKDDNACPYPTSVLSEAPNVKNIELFGMTHSELLIKKNAFYAIRYALNNEMPQSWINASKRHYEEHLQKTKK